MNETIDTNVNYTPDEVCATIEALYEAISNRFRWTVLSPDEGSGAEAWQTLDFDIARAALDMLVMAYTKTLLTLNTWPEEAVDSQFVKMFVLPSEIWDLLGEITTAKDWSHVPRHEFDPSDEECPVCRYLANRLE